MAKVLFAYSVFVLSLAAAGRGEFQVNTSTYGLQEYPAVAMDAAGNFVVVWRSKHTGSRGTYGQRFNSDGTPVGGEFQISTSSVGGRTTSGPSVGMDRTGNFVVAWTGYRDGEEHIVARRYDGRGAPLTDEFAVSTDLHADYENAHKAPSVAMNASGAFVIVWEAWHGDDGHNGNSYATGRSYDASGTPHGDEFIITQKPHGDKCDVAIDDSGDFVVAWVRSGDVDDLPYGEYIRFRRYHANGTPKGDAIQITGDLVGPRLPSIAMDGSGGFAISWQDHASDWREIDVYLQRFGADANSVGGPVLVNTHTTAIQQDVSLAMNGRGQLAAVWHSENQDGAGYGVYGQKFGGDGRPVCGECRVNSYTAGNQWYPEVAMNEAGRFVVVWASYKQDGSDYGIFGEIGAFSTTCCADLSGDLFVNLEDFAFLAGEWLKEGGSPEADLADDDVIDALDLQVLCEQWLAPCRL